MRATAQEIQTRNAAEKYLSASTLQKHSKISTANLKLKAQKLFNVFIRKRDFDMPCISCGSFNDIQAGHYHSAGQNNHLRFNEDNVNGQCRRRNFFLHGNLAKYRQNLLFKIGKARVERLDHLAADRAPHPTERIFLIEVIEKYK